tara:strand:+ start:165 stop:410 length:246 start_codon:yes stop_codon:yes gene_type:complete
MKRFLLPFLVVIAFPTAVNADSEYQLFISGGDQRPMGIMKAFKNYKACQKAGEKYTRKDSGYDKGYICKKIDWQYGFRQWL